LTIVDTHKRITNIIWKTEHFQFFSEFTNFFNELNYFQQRESKISQYGRSPATVILYPVLKEKKRVVTNGQVNLQAQTNKIEFSLFDKWKKYWN